MCGPEAVAVPLGCAVVSGPDRAAGGNLGALECLAAFSISANVGTAIVASPISAPAG